MSFTKPDELDDALVTQLKAQALAGALAMIFKTALGVGKGGQIHSSITGQEFEDLLNGTLSIPFTDEESKMVFNRVRETLVDYLTLPNLGLSAAQQKELRQQLIAYMDTNPDFKKLEEMSTLLLRNDYPGSKKA